MAESNIVIKYFSQKHMYGFVSANGELPYSLRGYYTSMDLAEKALIKYTNEQRANGPQLQKNRKRSQ